jgi:hypothetical protein
MAIGIFKNKKTGKSYIATKLVTDTTDITEGREMIEYHLSTGRGIPTFVRDKVEFLKSFEPVKIFDNN